MFAGVRAHAVRPGRGVPLVATRGLRGRRGRRLLTIAVQRPHGRALLLHLGRKPRCREEPGRTHSDSPAAGATPHATGAEWTLRAALVAWRVTTLSGFNPEPKHHSHINLVSWERPRILDFVLTYLVVMGVLLPPLSLLF